MKAQSRKFIVASSAISIMALSYAAFNQSNTNPTAPVKTNSINQSTTNSLSTTPLSVATPKLKSTIQAPTNSNTPIKNQYIVVLNPLSELPSTAAKNIAQQFGGKILFVYSKAVRGFAISIPETASEQFIQAM